MASGRALACSHFHHWQRESKALKRMVASILTLEVLIQRFSLPTERIAEGPGPFCSSSGQGRERQSNPAQRESNSHQSGQCLLHRVGANRDREKRKCCPKTPPSWRGVWKLLKHGWGLRVPSKMVVPVVLKIITLLWWAMAQGICKSGNWMAQEA